MTRAQRDPILETLVELVSRLRAPDGCPWDREQGLSDIRAYLLEEAHEVADAIDREAWEDLEGEMGDLLFQAAFIGCLAQEREAFTLDSAVDKVQAKMIARHPHVFGDEEASDAESVRQAWERRKLETEERPDGLLGGVPRSMPALVGAYRITQKAAGVGFDWRNTDEIFDKLDEEVSELRQAMNGDSESGGVEEEIGDLLFTVVNLARRLEIDPEAALARTNLKFRRRFRHIEESLEETGRTVGDATFEELEAGWQSAKAGEG